MDFWNVLLLAQCGFYLRLTHRNDSSTSLRIVNNCYSDKQLLHFQAKPYVMGLQIKNISVFYHGP